VPKKTETLRRDKNKKAVPPRSDKKQTVKTR
jgi:hypothetical protein